MRSNDEVLTLLNDLLTNELSAVNQYLLHAETCDNWGYSRLATKLREASLEERKHADLLIERILFLEGTPNVQRYHAIRAGASVKEQLERDLELEYAAIAALNDGIAKARDCRDNATEDLLTTIIVCEQDDAHWIEAQLELIRQVGEHNYLAQQMT